MISRIRYQTGELDEIAEEMKKGNIPCMDVDNQDELNWFVGQLSKKDIYPLEDIPYDKNARDRLKEPEFEFRASFAVKHHSGELDRKRILYIDFYFEPDMEETYDSIFGD